MRDGIYRKSVGVFVWDKDVFLVLLRKKDRYWGIPGGKVDVGESAPEAVIRELWEETGIVARLNQLHRLRTHRIDLGHEGLWEYVSFAVNLPATPTVTLNPDEHTDFVWVTPGSLLRYKAKGKPIFPGLIQVMGDVGYLRLSQVECGVKIQLIS